MLEEVVRVVRSKASCVGESQLRFRLPDGEWRVRNKLRTNSRHNDLKVYSPLLSRVNQPLVFSSVQALARELVDRDLVAEERVPDLDVSRARRLKRPLPDDASTTTTNHNFAKSTTTTTTEAAVDMATVGVPTDRFDYDADDADDGALPVMIEFSVHDLSEAMRTLRSPSQSSADVPAVLVQHRVLRAQFLFRRRRIARLRRELHRTHDAFRHLQRRGMVVRALLGEEAVRAGLASSSAVPWRDAVVRLQADLDAAQARVHELHARLLEAAHLASRCGRSIRDLELAHPRLVAAAGPRPARTRDGFRLSEVERRLADAAARGAGGGGGGERLTRAAVVAHAQAIRDATLAEGKPHRLKQYRYLQATSVLTNHDRFPLVVGALPLPVDAPRVFRCARRLKPDREESPPDLLFTPGADCGNKVSRAHVQLLHSKLREAFVARLVAHADADPHVVAYDVARMDVSPPALVGGVVLRKHAIQGLDPLLYLDGATRRGAALCILSVAVCDERKGFGGLILEACREMACADVDVGAECHVFAMCVKNAFWRDVADVTMEAKTLNLQMGMLEGDHAYHYTDCEPRSVRCVSTASTASGRCSSDEV
jgi:hypothetical protein